METVSADRISKTFGRGETEVRALQGVSLSLSAGTVVALLGPSGAGKSTLVKALGLVDLPDTGTIAYRGRPIVVNGRACSDVTEFRRRHIGFVFQKANLVSFLTARENVEIVCEFAGTRSPRRRSMELLHYLDVAHRANAYPETLSGGEQQRIAIARGLANSPSLVLADEPTAALDSARGRMVMELFRRVAHEHGTTVLVVTHDHRALDVFDATYTMEDGRASLNSAPSASSFDVGRTPPPNPEHQS